MWIARLAISGNEQQILLMSTAATMVSSASSSTRDSGAYPHTLTIVTGTIEGLLRSLKESGRSWTTAEEGGRHVLTDLEAWLEIAPPALVARVRATVGSLPAPRAVVR